jgi:hypothetical protein
MKLCIVARFVFTTVASCKQASIRKPSILDTFRDGPEPNRSTTRPSPSVGGNGRVLPIGPAPSAGRDEEDVVMSPVFVSSDVPIFVPSDGPVVVLSAISVFVSYDGFPVFVPSDGPVLEPVFVSDIPVSESFFVSDDVDKCSSRDRILQFDYEEHAGLS